MLKGVYQALLLLASWLNSMHCMGWLHSPFVSK